MEIADLELEISMKDRQFAAATSTPNCRYYLQVLEAAGRL